MVPVALYGYARQLTEIGGVGGLTLHTTDVLFFLTIAWCAAVPWIDWQFFALEKLNLFWCLIPVFNFGRGMLGGQLANLGIQFRGFSNFIAAAIFIPLARERISFDWIFDKIVLLGWGLVVLSLVRLLFGVDTFVAAGTIPQGGDPRP